MKKLMKCFGFLLFLLVASPAFSQVVYDKADKLVNVGLGFGNYFAGGVPITASFEYFVNDAISVGPYIGFTSYNYAYSTYKYNYTFIDFGARGAYHFSKHIDMNTDKLDLYGALILGFTASSYSGGSVGYNPYGSRVRAGATAGARWYFTDGFSVNGEVGYGLAPLLLGVTFKF